MEYIVSAQERLNFKVSQPHASTDPQKTSSSNANTIMTYVAEHFRVTIFDL